MSRTSSPPSLIVLVAAVILFAAVTTSTPLQQHYVPSFLPKRQDSGYDINNNGNPQNPQGGPNGGPQGAVNGGDQGGATDGTQSGGPMDIVPAMTGSASTPADYTGTPDTGSWTNSGSATPTPGGDSYTQSSPAASTSTPAMDTYSWPATSTSTPATDSYSWPTTTTSSSVWMPEPTPPANTSIPTPPGRPAGNGLEWCGPQRYSPTVYTCYGNTTLCPFINGEAYEPCGKACYPPSKYECRGDKLQTLHKPGSPTSPTVDVPSLPTGAASMSSNAAPSWTGSQMDTMSTSSMSPSMTYSYPAPAGASGDPKAQMRKTDLQPQSMEANSLLNKMTNIGIPQQGREGTLRANAPSQRQTQVGDTNFPNNGY